MQPVLGKTGCRLLREVSRRVTYALKPLECGVSAEFRGFFNSLI